LNAKHFAKKYFLPQRLRNKDGYDISSTAVLPYDYDDLGPSIINGNNPADGSKTLRCLSEIIVQLEAFKMLSISGRSVLCYARKQLNVRAYPTSVQSLSALARLLSSLAVLEQREGKLNHGSLSAVTAAQKLGGSVTGFIAGSNVKAVAEEAARVAGIDKVVAVDNEAYDKVRMFCSSVLSRISTPTYNIL
jgi:hypothetical protein